MHNECWGIILAAGQGRRMAEATGGEAKQFLRWKNAPLWWHSAQAMTRFGLKTRFTPSPPPQSAGRN